MSSFDAILLAQVKTPMQHASLKRYLSSQWIIATLSFLCIPKTESTWDVADQEQKKELGLCDTTEGNV